MDTRRPQTWSLVSLPKEPAIEKGFLPAFSMRRYGTIVTAGKRIDERKRAECWEERERWTALFVMPGLPPLAMGPAVHSSYWENCLKSDLRYKRLFPNDVESRSLIKDVEGEYEALYYYEQWLVMETVDAANPRRRFYTGLLEEVTRDWEEVTREREAMLAKATPLGRFEWFQLDNDGGTTFLVHHLQKGTRCRDESDDEVQATYGHLIRQYRPQ